MGWQRAPIATPLHQQLCGRGHGRAAGKSIGNYRRIAAEGVPVPGAVMSGLVARCLSW